MVTTLATRLAAARRSLIARGIGDYRRLARVHLAVALVMGLWGGLDALFLRTVLATPEAGPLAARTYDAFFTTHGLTMLFLFATPAVWGFAYLVVPPVIGAERTSFPVLGALGAWLLVPAAVVMRAGTVGAALGVAGLRPVGTGWTLYPPLSTSMPNPAVDLLLVGLLLVVAATTATSANLAVTIARRRRLAWRDLDAFTWTVLTAAGMALASFPVLAFAAGALLADRNLGTALAGAGGDPVTWQHVFWFFAHPFVYVLALVPMGIVSHVLPRFSGRRLYAPRSAIYSTLAIGVLSFAVWGHHMFATGMDLSARVAFSILTLAVAVPSSAKLCSWLGTVWHGDLRLTVPALFLLAGIGIFTVGGATGVVLAVAPVNVSYTGTYYVVAHFHFALVGLVAFSLVAGTYFWFPLLTGRRYDRSLARLHAWLTVLGVAIAFGALLLVGALGLPRRVATYPAAFAPLHQLATVGAYLIAAGQVVFLALLGTAWLADEPAADDPWDLEDGPNHAREWR